MSRKEIAVNTTGEEAQVVAVEHVEAAGAAVLHEPPPVVDQSPMAKVDTLVEAWFHEHVRNSPVAQETRAWNHMVEAKEALKRALVVALF